MLGARRRLYNYAYCMAIQTWISAFGEYSPASNIGLQNHLSRSYMTCYNYWAYP